MIIGFQLRAAKAVLKLTAKQIAGAIDVHQGTIVRLGFTKNLEYIRCNSKNLILLKKFFELHGILFPDENTISLKTTITPIPITNQLTRFQLKAARIATGLTQKELSSCIKKVSSSTISLLEQLKDIEYIESTKINISLLKKYFEHLGIIFANDLSVSLIKDPQLLSKKSQNNN
jgi:DNA-binding XRE family transcriptional regulator